MRYCFIDETGQIKYFSKDFRISKRYNLYINLSLCYSALQDNTCCTGGGHLPLGISPQPHPADRGSAVYLLGHLIRSATKHSD